MPPPKAIDPVSPIKIFCRIFIESEKTKACSHQRRAKRSCRSGVKQNTGYHQKTEKPAASLPMPGRPSPSVRLTLFAIATITNETNGHIKPAQIPVCVYERNKYARTVSRHFCLIKSQSDCDQYLHRKFLSGREPKIPLHRDLYKIIEETKRSECQKKPSG